MADPIHAFDPDGTPSPGAQAALDGKADAGHSHVVADVDGLDIRLGPTAVAVTFVNNTEADVPTRTDTVPGGWVQVDPGASGIVFSGDAFTVTTAGTYLINLVGTYNNGPTVGAYEYRIVKNTTRLLALFGEKDHSTRSGACATTLTPTDEVRVQYRHSSGETLGIRPNNFNTVTFTRIV